MGFFQEVGKVIRQRKDYRDLNTPTLCATCRIEPAVYELWCLVCYMDITGVPPNQTIQFGTRRD